MSKQMNEAELTVHCEEAVSDIKQLFLDFSKAKESKIIKRSMLIAYWFKQYVKYLRKEDNCTCRIWIQSRSRIGRTTLCCRFGL